MPESYSEGITTNQTPIKNEKTPIPPNPNEIWRSGNISVVRPEKPTIPLQEGNHFVITNDEDKDWSQMDPKLLAKLAYYQVAVANVVAQGRESGDLWANLHFDRDVSVYGRNPNSEKAWRKPVDKTGADRNGGAPDLSETDLKKTMQRYLPLWKKSLKNMELFENGVQSIDPGTLDTPNSIWANRKFKVILVDSNPHVNGLHLVLLPRKEYWDKIGPFRRPWQTHSDTRTPEPEYLQAYIEGVVIMASISRLIAENQATTRLYNGEIHGSGNWNPEMLFKKDGGMIDETKIDDPSKLKSVKRELRPGARKTQKDENGNYLRDEDGNPILEDQSTELTGEMHLHGYYTDDPQAYVTLPTRPKDEVLNEWEGISATPIEKAELVKNLVANQLTTLLEQARGPIIEKQQ